MGYVMSDNVTHFYIQCRRSLWEMRKVKNKNEK